jgi:hypothetical protein
MPFPWALLFPGLAILGFFIFVSSLIFMKPWFGFFFQPQTSHNAVGILKAGGGEPVRRVVICGHIDSAYMMNITRLGDRIATVTLSVVALLLVSLVVAIIRLFWSPPAMTWLFVGLLVPLVLSLGLLYWGYNGNTPVPGANDNLAGVAVALALAQRFSPAEARLHNVELWVGAFGAEECGERGSEHFVKLYGDVFRTNGCCVVPESMGGGTHLAILSAEKMHVATHDMTVCQELLAAYECTAKTFPCAIEALPFAATDAGRFSLKGISASAILGYEGAIMKPSNWHELTDDPDHLNPAMMELVYAILEHYLLALDRSLSRA